MNTVPKIEDGEGSHLIFR